MSTVENGLVKQRLSVFKMNEYSLVARHKVMQRHASFKMPFTATAKNFFLCT